VYKIARRPSNFKSTKTIIARRAAPAAEQYRPPPVPLQKHKNNNRPSRRLGYRTNKNFFSFGLQ
jgi:hypothetical protein